MKVELTSEECFTVAANGKTIPGMRVVSEWEGFKKLQDSAGNSLIVAGTGGAFSDAFADIFPSKSTVKMIIAGSPCLIKALSADEPGAGA